MSEEAPRSFSSRDAIVLFGVFAILGALFTLCAGPQHRGPGRRAVCHDNQSQLALAALAFETNHGRFPGWRESIGGREASWCVALLPNLDQQALYDLWNDPHVPRSDPRLTPFISPLVCPSSSTPDRNGPYSSYVANAGFLPRGSDPTLPGFDPREEGSADGVFVNRMPEHDKQGRLVLDASHVTAADLVDGMSYTVLFSESLLAANWTYASLHAKYPQPQDAPYPSGATVMTFLYASEDAPAFVNSPVDAGLPPPGLVTPAMKINHARRELRRFEQLTVEHVRPSSHHTGGVVMSFADKHAQFIREDIDYRVYQQLLTPHSAESHAPHRQLKLVPAETD